ncbi:MAG: oxygen-independent coproporphyrinogen III oxidase [Herminiimonas sp.]|nr:oxygen-independent coproporphyrinogen III oxidase [Herminiimonas sp.]
MPANMPVVAMPSPTEFNGRLTGNRRPADPRYGCYPTADRFTDAFGYRDYLQAVASLRTRGSNNPLALSLHIPFCGDVGEAGGTNKMAMRNREKAVIYLSYLKREIEIQGRLFDGMNQVAQLHIGGAPSCLSDVHTTDLMRHARCWFRFAADEVGDYSVEVDAHAVSENRVHRLREQGFNRISIAIQDGEGDADNTGNHMPLERHMLAVIDAAHAARFRSISIDLEFGRPKQTLVTIAQTLDDVIGFRPDRVTVRPHPPSWSVSTPQRHSIDEDSLGDALKDSMYAQCIAQLTHSGYVHIGLEQFAKPADELVIAQRQGRLYRSFHGYSTHPEANLVACGVGAISSIAATCCQNARTLETYYDRLDSNQLPIVRGIKLTMDDVLRRSIIHTLMCNFEISATAIELAYPITFADYFSAELGRLQAFAADGLITVDDEWISATVAGRLLITNICMVFDRCLYAGSASRRVGTAG